MKVLILAGGFGTRISEETDLKPKPMIEIGGKPMLWHIMKTYSHFGFNDFVILTGYKGYYIKEYFANYFLHQSDVTFNLQDNTMQIHKTEAEKWKVTVIDTGLNTMTGGRIKRAKEYIKNEPFMCTYGDGLADINIHELIKFHKSTKGLCTLTSIQPEGRFGALEISDNNQITSFKEKPKGDGAYINGGFFVCEPEVLDYIEGDHSILERDPLENLAKDNKLFTYRHHGFWQCMDTLRDKNYLSDLWDKSNAKWKMW